jgi:hypothetical protein
MRRMGYALAAVFLVAAPLAAQLPRALPEAAGMSAARLARIRTVLDDPKEHLAAVLMMQRFPFDGVRVSSVFRTLVYQAITR